MKHHMNQRKTVCHRYIQQGLFVPAAPEALLIGTFPSVLIKEAFGQLGPADVNFYYGSTSNLFWRDLERIYNRKLLYNFSQEAVEQRKDLLEKLKLAITDIIESCDTEGGVTDTSLGGITIHEGVISILDQHPGITRLFFTSSSGKVSAERLSLNLLNSSGRISASRISQKSAPKIREFIYTDHQNNKRAMQAVSLYSPSPFAKRYGVTDEKRNEQYKTYLPKMSNIRVR